MLTGLVIALYIISIFVSRFLNRLAYVLDDYCPLPFIWFIPVVNIAMCVTAVCAALINNAKLWPKFKGDHW